MRARRRLCRMRLPLLHQHLLVCVPICDACFVRVVTREAVHVSGKQRCVGTNTLHLKELVCQRCTRAVAAPRLAALGACAPVSGKTMARDGTAVP